MEMQSDQIYHDLEQRYVSLRNDHDAVCQENLALKRKITILEEDLSNSRTSASSLTLDTTKYESEIKVKDVKLRNIEHEIEKLNEDYQRKCDESDRLREDIKMQADQLTTLQSRLREMTNLSTENETKLLPLQYELNTVTREKEICSNRIKWLETELEQKNNELYQIKRENLSKQQQTELQLAQKNNECGEYQEKCKQFEDRFSLQNEKIEQYLNQIRSLEELKAAQQNDFLKELTAQKKLVDVYKVNLDDSLKHIERLEENLTTMKSSFHEQVNQHKLKVQELVEHHATQLSELETNKNNQIMELEKKLNELMESIENRDTQSLTLGKKPNQQEENYLPTEYELIGQGHSLTTLYSQLVQYEKELNNERITKKELELYLDRILKDIEVKGPMIASLRRDHMRLVESHDQLTKRYDELSNESHKAKRLQATYEKEFNEMKAESIRLNHMNQDLCKQIQHLLRLQNYGNNALSAEQQQAYQQQLNQFRPGSMALVTTSANDVISEYLVVYDTIDELQKRNIQLLSIVRRLSSEQEEKDASPRSENNQLQLMNQDEIQSTLTHTLNELEMMRESRQRMEEMVNSLIQQRDIYRAMLEEVDGAGSRMDAAAGALVRSQSGTLPSTPTSTGKHSQRQMEALQLKLGETEELLHRSQDRCERLQHIEETLNTSIEKLREENSSLRTLHIQSSSSLQFHQNRLSSLESSLQSLQISYELLSNKKSELDGILLTHQQTIQEKDLKLSEVKEQLRYQTEQAYRLNIEKDVLKDQEKRYYQQILSLQEELKKQSQLNESLYRLENNLTGNLSTQLKRYEEEIERYQNQVGKMEKNEVEYKVITEHKLQSNQTEIQSLQLLTQQQQQELKEWKELLNKEQTQAQGYRERVGLLEKELSVSQERLYELHHSNLSSNPSTFSSSMAESEKEKDLTISRQLLSIERLENELKISHATSEQYKQISLTTEKLFEEYQQKVNQKKSEEAEAKVNLESELNELKREIGEKRNQIIELMKENEELNEVHQNTLKQQQAQLETYRQEVSLLTSNSSNSQSEITKLQSDLTTLNHLLKESTNNYERELLQHSNSIQSFKQLEAQHQLKISQYEKLELTYQNLTLKCMEYEKVIETLRNQSEQMTSSLKEELETMKHTNNLLHNQIQIMSYEMNKNTQQILFKITENDENPSASSDEPASELQISPQSTIHELREVIKYMKREKDMVDARFHVCEMEKLRYLNETIALQKSMDELRHELQATLERNQLSSSGSSARMRTEEELQQLMADVSQLNLLRESNIHLRNENTESKKTINELREKLEQSEKEKLPMTEKIIRLETEISLMTTEKQTLLNDCNYWKERLHQLISRYNDVDPEEHRLLKEKLAKTEELCQQLTTENDGNRTRVEELEQVLRGKVEELTSMKSTAETMEKTSENLRGKLREFNKQIQSQRTQMSQLTSTCDSHQQKITEQQSVIEKLQNDISVANNATQDANNQAAIANAALASAQALLTQQKEAPPTEQSQPAVTIVTPPPVVPVPVAPVLSVPLPVVPVVDGVMTDAALVSSEKKAELQNLRDAALKRFAASKNKKQAGTEAESEAPAAKKVKQNPKVAAKQKATPTSPAPAPAPISTPAVALPSIPVAPFNTPFNPSSQPVVPPQPVQTKCFFFTTPDGCRYGESCRYSHILEETPIQNAVESHELIESTKEVEDMEEQPSGPSDSIEEIVEVSKDMEVVQEEFQSQTEEIKGTEQPEIESPQPEEEETPTDTMEAAEEIPTPPLVSVASAVVAPPQLGASKPTFGSNAPFKMFSSFGRPVDSAPSAQPEAQKPKLGFFGAKPTPTIETQPPPVESLNSSATPTQSPFLPLRPPSPSSAKITLQFGSGTPKLSVPSNLPPASSNPVTGTATIPAISGSFKGGSLFQKATATTTPTPTFGRISSGGLLAAGAPAKAFAITTPLKTPSKPVEPVEPIQPNEEDYNETDEPEMIESELAEGSGDHQNQNAAALPTTVSLTAEQRRLARFARFGKEQNGKKEKSNTPQLEETSKSEE